ncbi:peptidase, M16 family protein [Belliella pelovolcani]|uniref:peptidase, M16 family protein n=1 Tax=Belliella pelovolcani TaxID=529505 RepID=UPI00391C2E29
MKKPIFLLAAALLIGSGAKAEPFNEKEIVQPSVIMLAELDPDEVIAKYIQAVGGMDKISKVKSAYVLTEADFQGTMIETTVKSDSENGRLKQETKVMGQVQQRMILKDGKGFAEMGGQKQELPDEMFELSKSQMYVFPEPHYKALGLSMELRGTEKVEGEEANVLVLTLSNGMKTVEYYSVSSGLKLKSSSDAAGDIIYSDYKDVEGVLYPHTITVVSPMLPFPLESKIKSIEFNKVFSDADFN